MPSESIVYQGRTRDYTITLQNQTGNPIVLGALDTVRVKIGVAGNTPDLDLLSGVPTANGTLVSITQPGTVSPPSPAILSLHLDQGDTANLRVGPLDLEIDVVSQAEGGKTLDAGVNVLTVVRQLGGNLN